MARSREEVLKAWKRLETLKTQQASKLKLLQKKMERTEESLKQMLQKEKAERVQRVGEMVLKKAGDDESFKNWLIEQLTSSFPESTQWLFHADLQEIGTPSNDRGF